MKVVIKTAASSANLFASKHLLAQSQPEKHYKKGWNMFKINSKNARTMSAMLLCWLYLLILSIFTPFSSFYIVDFQEANVCWEANILKNLLKIYKSWRLLACIHAKYDLVLRVIVLQFLLFWTGSYVTVCRCLSTHL